MLSKDSSVQIMHSKQQQSVQQQQQHQQNVRKSVGVMGSRRIFAPAFKLKVLHSYRNDMDCRGNQRATARKYGIHRRQIQKWLQCEANLKTTCAENGVTSISMTDSSAGISKTDDTVTETVGSAVTLAPALNLIVTRLHGDELTTQQGPPPLPPHPPHDSAPSSPQYSLQTTAIDMPISPLRMLSVGQQYSSSSEQQHHRKLESIVRASDMIGFSDVQVDQDRNYYVLNSDTQKSRNAERAKAFDGRNEITVYQTMSNYHSSHQEHQYGISDTSAHHHHSPDHHSQSYGDVDSFDGKSYVGLPPAPSMIKTEPASPDSTATSGPYESSGSPGSSWAPLSPISHRTNSNGSSSLSVHFNSPRDPASPYLDVHVRENTRAYPPPDSEKPIPSRLHQQERESEETTEYIEGKGERKTPEKTQYCKTVIKEEVELDEEQTHDNGEEGNTSSYIDVSSGPSAHDPEPIIPVHDREGYSLPSSPRDPVNSGRSSTSWSDSEMYTVDWLLSGQNPSGNLTRRRSFPLRFKLDVLDAFHRDAGVAGNQRATARKFGINRRQVQKWLGQETELRGEIALRGNSRQRLGPIQDGASGESPMDLRTMNYVSSDYNRPPRDPVDSEYEPPSPHLYCCDTGSVSSQHLSYNQIATEEPSIETEPVESYNFPCCIDKQRTMSTTSSNQDLSLRESYTESPGGVHCYSPRDYSEFSNLSEGCEQVSPPLKRHSHMLACCYDALQSSKRFCPDDAPQDAPLCLVKPKRTWEISSSRTEPTVTNAAPVPSDTGAPQPSLSTSNRDGILFKPYLDNPVCKPANEDTVHHGLSPVTRENNNNNDSNINNKNCQSICNFNEGQDRNFQFNLQLPLSWSFPEPYTELQEVGSTFIRYPVHPESTCNFILNPLRPGQTRTSENRKLVEEQTFNRVIHTFRLHTLV